MIPVITFSISFIVVAISGFCMFKNFADAFKDPLKLLDLDKGAQSFWKRFSRHIYSMMGIFVGSIGMVASLLAWLYITFA